MALPLFFRRRVGNDLAAAFEWYEKQRSGLGSEFRSAIETSFHAIAEHPKLFATVHGEVRRAILSRFPFAVFYLVEAERVVVLRVLHTARNPELWPKFRRETP